MSTTLSTIAPRASGKAPAPSPQMEFDWAFNFGSEFVPISKVAANTHFSRRHILNMIEDGTLEAVDWQRKDNGPRKQPRVIRKSLLAFLERRKIR